MINNILIPKLPNNFLSKSFLFNIKLIINFDLICIASAI